MARKLTKEEAVDIIRNIHGNKYMGVDDIVYIDTHSKFVLTCPEHGDFLINLKAIKEGRGCPKCGHINGGKSRKRDTETFVKKAMEVHKNKYDYSKVVYTDCETKVCIICPVHGEFWQSPSAHLRGQGCPECAIKKNADSLRKPLDDFLNKAREIHYNKYDYSNVQYINSDTQVTIVCPTHGAFNQTPYNHLKGQGCPVCARERVFQSLNDTVLDFIAKAKEVHGDRYDYSKVNYVRSKDDVEIICKKHGSFYQKPNNHLMGHGCPCCGVENIDSVSNSEKEIREFIGSIYNDNIIFNDRSVIPPYELDIYLPHIGLAFEIDGLYWHNEVNKPDRNYHLKKTDECIKKGIQLIHIFEDEWLYKQEITKSRIKNLLGLSECKIGARQCTVKEVSGKNARDFLNINHIQGACGSMIKLWIILSK